MSGIVFQSRGGPTLFWQKALGLILLYALSVTPTGASVYRGCAVIDADVILNETKIGKRVLADLEAEFRPREREVLPFTRVRNAAEKRWLDAVESDLTKPEIEAARREFDKASAEEAALLKALRSDSSWRRLQESTKILDKASGVYADLGRRLRYAKLYQKGYGQPVIEPEAQARSFECQSKDDVTAELVRDIDKRFP